MSASRGAPFFKKAVEEGLGWRYSAKRVVFIRSQNCKSEITTANTRCIGNIKANKHDIMFSSIPAVTSIQKKKKNIAPNSTNLNHEAVQQEYSLLFLEFICDMCTREFFKTGFPLAMPREK